MKKIFTIIVLAAMSLTAVAQRPKMAIYPAHMDGSYEMIQNYFVTAFTEKAYFSIVERSSAFQKALQKEYAYQQSGMIDEKTIAKLGKQSGVQYICLVDEYSIQEVNYLAAQIIDTETAIMVANSLVWYDKSSNMLYTVRSMADIMTNMIQHPKEDATPIAIYVIPSGDPVLDRDLQCQLSLHFSSQNSSYIVTTRSGYFNKNLQAERKFQQSGMVSDEQITRLGKQIGTKYVCIAKITRGKEESFISARVLNAETAEIVQSAVVPLKIKNGAEYLGCVLLLASQLAYMPNSEEKYSEAQSRKNQKDRIKVALDAIMQYANNKGKDWSYRGGLLNGKRFGMGIVNISDLDVYIGNWNNGQREGEGIYYVLTDDDRYINGSGNEAKVYVGAWKDGTMNGVGKYYDHGGDLVFWGESEKGNQKRQFTDSIDYKDYKFEIIESSDSAIYIGETKNGRRHGLGMVLSKGHLLYGVWNNGVSVGRCMILPSDGTYGTYTIKNGKIVDNDYVNLGLPSGTKWAFKSSLRGFYSFGEAARRFGVSFVAGLLSDPEEYIPCKAQWEELVKECSFEWIGSGYKVTGPNGNYIFLYDYQMISDYTRERKPNKEKNGHFWTSDIVEEGAAWEFYFDKDVKTFKKKMIDKKAGVHLVRVY